MKKVISLVLVIAMVLSSMSFAFASTFPDVTGDYENAIDALVALKVVNGYEDGTFRAENTITRAELAKVLVEALGYGDLVAGANSSFSDTQMHWANGYIAIAAGTGLVMGYPDGTFLPDKAVTYDEALTMVVRALGYTDASLKGTWPTNYKVKAIDLDLTDDVMMKTSAADRGGVAQIIYNALEAYLVEVDADDVAVVGTEMLIGKIATYDSAYEVTAESIDSTDKNFAGEYMDLTPYMYQSLKVYMNDDDQVVYIKGSNNLVLDGVLNDTTDLTGSAIIVEDADEDDYSFTITTGTSFMMNGVEIDYADRANVGVTTALPEDVKVTVVIDAEDDDSLKSGVYDALGVVVEKQTKVVQIADEYVTGKTKIDAITLPENDDDEVDLDNITVTGDAESLEDIMEDDIVLVYAGTNSSGTLEKITLVVSRDTVEGMVTRINGTSYYVDGTKYTYNDNVTPSTDLKLGSEGTFYLDGNGEIAAYDGTSGTSNYAVVMGVEAGDVTTSFSSVSIDDYPQIKLATEDNELVVYDVYVKMSSAKITDSATINSTSFISTTKTYTGTDAITSAAFAALADPMTVDGDLVNQLVKYKLNTDGQISEITFVGDKTTFDEDDSNYVFASDAVIFDATDDDYAVIAEDKLKSSGDALIAYNDDGEIAALVTMDVSAGSASVYAFVDTINDAYNSDNDEVQLFVAYLNGEKVEYLSDDDYNIATSDKVYALDLDGDVITSAPSLATSSAAIKVSAISTATNSLTVEFAVAENGISLTAGQRVFLTDEATILKLKADDAESIMDLYDIKDMTVTAYFNTDGDIAFITYGVTR